MCLVLHPVEDGVAISQGPFGHKAGGKRLGKHKQVRALLLVHQLGKLLQVRCWLSPLDGMLYDGSLRPSFFYC
jgi:hypothetical protein